MMNLTLLNSLLLSICATTAPLREGDRAPCTGLLWSPSQSRLALKCSRVTVPTLKAELGLCKETKKIEVERLSDKLELAESQIENMDPPNPPWLIPSVAAGSFVIGVLVVALSVGAR